MRLSNEQISKYYSQAKTIAGELGNDLLHHVILKLPTELKHPDTYIFKCMINEWIDPQSKFNKLHRLNNPYISEDIEEYIAEPFTKYDAILLHKILLELEIEGYILEVAVYKESALVSSYSKVSRNTKVNRITITKICKFVENEIRTRYALLDV